MDQRKFVIINNKWIKSISYDRETSIKISCISEIIVDYSFKDHFGYIKLFITIGELQSQGISWLYKPSEKDDLLRDKEILEKLIYETKS